MILDDAITAALIITVAGSLLSKKGAAFAVLLLFSHLFNLAIYNPNPSWVEFIQWIHLSIAKDFLLIAAFGFMLNRHCFIIMLTFVASCVFHQFLLAQANTGIVDNLTLLVVRPDFMKFIVICQLSTVYHAILTGGGIDGGKRAKCNLLFSDHRRNQFFCQQAFKAKR